MVLTNIEKKLLPFMLPANLMNVRNDHLNTPSSRIMM